MAGSPTGQQRQDANVQPPRRDEPAIGDAEQACRLRPQPELGAPTTLVWRARSMLYIVLLVVLSGSSAGRWRCSCQGGGGIPSADGGSSRPAEMAPMGVNLLAAYPRDGFLVEATSGWNQFKVVISGPSAIVDAPPPEIRCDGSSCEVLGVSAGRRFGAALALVVDGSGSMEKAVAHPGCEGCPTDPARARARAVRSFARSLPTGMRLGLYEAMDAHSESEYGAEQVEHWQSSGVVRALADYPAEAGTVADAASLLGSYGCTSTFDAIVEVATHLRRTHEPGSDGIDIIVVTGSEDNCSERTITEAIAELQHLRAHVHVIALGRFGVSRSFEPIQSFQEELVMSTRYAIGQWRAIADMTDGSLVLGEISDVEAALLAFSQAVGQVIPTATIESHTEPTPLRPHEVRLGFELHYGEATFLSSVYDSRNTILPLSAVDELVDEQVELLVKEFDVDSLDPTDSDFEGILDSGVDRIAQLGPPAVSRILSHINQALRSAPNGVRASVLFDILLRVSGERPPVSARSLRDFGLFAFEEAWLGWWRGTGTKPMFSRWTPTRGER